jgi:hypothetical protein
VTLRKIQLLINQVKKLPNHTVANSNLLPRYRTIIDGNSSALSRASEEEASKISKRKFFWQRNKVNCLEETKTVF